MDLFGVRLPHRAVGLLARLLVASLYELGDLGLAKISDSETPVINYYGFACI
jgi:hypothetical protein